MNSKKILFLSPYPPGTAGSQRFRFEQYFEQLQKAGFTLTYQSFLTDWAWEILYRPGQRMKKGLAIIRGFMRRFWILFASRKYDFVFVHREASPIGPPLFEWILTKFLRKKVIYDFDDAIWLTNTSANNRMATQLKFHRKTQSICRWSYKVSCGNQYLLNYASKYNRNVLLNPTTIDTQGLHVPAKKSPTKLTIGWTGSHSTLTYLKMIVSPLERLSKILDYDFIVIADKAPDFHIPNLIFRKFDKHKEISDLNDIDIGVMPLEDNEWSKGKCGFKALQFMALEKPVLVSPVGVNSKIVDPGVHGFHCENDDEWVRNLKTLLADESLRDSMGKEGRKRVVEQYSVLSNERNFLSLFT